MKKRSLAVSLAICLLLGSCSAESPQSNKEKVTEQTTVSSTTTTAASETAAPVTLPPEPEQVVNDAPATYESFGIDKSEKTDFNRKVIENTKLPIVSVTTKDDEKIVSLDEYVSCVVDVFNCDEAQILDEASAGIRVRGNSSAFYGDVSEILKNTVPYRIKFDSRTNMLGMNGGAECKSWVLLKSDWDLIRNDIAFRFGRAIIGDNAFCSDSRFVHLYVNEKFQGIYVLCEQCQVDKERVDITEPEAGYTGTDIGYYLELDNYAMSDPDNHYVSMDYGGYEVTDIEGETRQFVSAEYSIKNDLYSQEQIDFISKYLHGVFEIVYRACEKGEYLTFDDNYELVESDLTSAEEAVSAVMDVQSVVDMYLLYEIVHDYDCGEGSFYMCVDMAENSKCPKLQFTSPWDFNWAYNDSSQRYWAAAFCEQSFADQYGDRSNPWFIILMKQDWFAELAKEKWSQLKSENAIDSCIDEEIYILKEYESDLNKTDEWATACSYDLLDWIYDRIDWLDKTFLG